MSKKTVVTIEMKDGGSSTVGAERWIDKMISDQLGEEGVDYTIKAEVVDDV